MSLKTKVTLFTLLIFVISIWALSYYAARMLKEDMQRMLGEQQATVVAHLAADINQDLEERFRVLGKVAGIITPAVLNNKAALRRLLEQRLILQDPFNGGVIAVGLDGTVTAELPPSTGRVGINYMDRDYIAATLKSGRSTISKPVVGKKPLVPLFGMSVPIFDKQGTVIGALVGVTNLDKSSFLDKITQHRYGKSGYYLLEEPKDRMIITGSDRSRSMTSLPARGVNHLIDRHVDGYDETGITVNPLGVEVLASAKHIPVAGWFIVAALPTTEAFAPIYTMHQRMIIATIFLTLLAGILIWWMLWRQLSPMFTTVQTLAAMSGTNQHLQPLPIARDDEIGQLIGGFNGLLGILAKREIALRESEARLQAIIMNEPECIKIIDAQGRLTFMNPAGLEMIEADSLEQVAGKSVMGVIAPEYRKDYANLCERVINGETVQMQYEVLGFKGGRRWLETHAVPMQDDGQTIHLAVTRDISQRKHSEDALRKSEEHFRAFFERSMIGMAESSPTKGWIKVNDRLCEMLGYSEDELRCMTWAQITHPDDLSEQEAKFERVLRGEADEYEMDKRFIHRDGRFVYTYLAVRCVRHEDGTIDYLVALVEDITRRKMAEAKLQTFNDELRKQVEIEVASRMQMEAQQQKEREALIQSEKMAQLGNMLGAIIHQWKQPLNLIALETQGMGDSYKYNELDAAEIERIEESIIRNIQFMSQTADDFRDFYKPSKEKKAFSVIEQINSVVKLLGKQLKISNIDLSIEGDEEICTTGFTSEFKQVVLNIINNAKDVFEEKGIKAATLRIKVAKEGEKAVLTITDNAGGIPNELLPDKLFEAFESTKGEKGTGIGLSISRTIIEENMQGRLTAENRDDGACFRVELPIA